MQFYGFFVYSVGATIGRPPDLQNTPNGRTQFAPTENNHRTGVNILSVLCSGIKSYKKNF